MGTFGLNNKNKLLIVFLCLVLYLPFLDKAFHIDDVGFIEPARMIGWSSHATKGIEGEGGETAKTLPTPYYSTHTVFLSYWIKFVSLLFGEYELPLHIAYLIFPILTVLCIYTLHERWYPQGTAVTFSVILMYVSIPAFLVNSHTIMADVPSLAFLLLFLCIFFHGEDKKKPFYYYLAGIVLCCAVLSSYQTIFIVLPTAIYAAAKKIITVHVVVALLMPLMLVVVYLVLLFELYGVILVRFSDFSGPGAGIASEIKRGLTLDVVVGKVANILALIGASLLFVYAFRLTMLQQTRLFLLKLLVASACLLFPCSIITPGYSLMEKAGFVLLVSLGVLILVEVVRTSMRSDNKVNRPRDLLLLLWILSVIGYNILVMPFGAARYLLPALLPMVFILLDVPQMITAKRSRRATSVAVVVAAVIIGLASAYSDYAYADTYGTFPERSRTSALRGLPRSRFGMSGDGGCNTTWIRREASCSPRVRQSHKKGILSSCRKCHVLDARAGSHAKDEFLCITGVSVRDPPAFI